MRTSPRLPVLTSGLRWSFAGALARIASFSALFTLACSQANTEASATAVDATVGSTTAGATTGGSDTRGSSGSSVATIGGGDVTTGIGSSSGGGPGASASTSGDAGTGVGGNTSGTEGATAAQSTTGGTPPPETTSAELLAAVGMGWNLGNSLDVPEGETAWGNPAVTASVFEGVKAQGFGLVRIPVTWSLSLGPGPEFAIDAERLARVGEVVGFARSAGLLAIINVHHDGADAYDGVEWLTLNDSEGNISEANNTAVREQFVRVWTQIADYFADYDTGLLFESMNEIHDGYDAPDPAYYDIISDLNQTFVDLVRSSGGNNPTRHLVVPGYNTNIDYTVAGFELPADTTPEHLILSVHYYDPWDYAGAATTNTWGAASPGSDTWGQEDHVVSQFDKLKTTFVDQGIPMIVGEYGAVHQEGFDDYRRYYMEYVTKAARDRGIVPVFWDNGGAGSGEDAFGLFDRTSGAVLHPEVLSAMVRATTENYSLAEIALPTP